MRHVNTLRTLGLVGLGLVLLMGSGSPTDKVLERDEVAVWFAARTLNPGIPIQEQDLYGLMMPADLVPVGAFLVPGMVVDRIPRERILANEPVLAERIGTVAVPRGMQGVVVAPVAGAGDPRVAPGDYVDLGMWSPRSAEVQALLHAVFVLAVFPAPEGEPPRVELIVTEEQARTIAHAQHVEQSGEGHIVVEIRRDCHFGPARTYECRLGAREPISGILGLSDRLDPEVGGVCRSAPWTVPAWAAGWDGASSNL